MSCGSVEFVEAPVSVECKQVAQLVARPIEVVEYQRQKCKCVHCGQTNTADWQKEIVPGQDLSVGWQSLLVWLGNYGHLSYEKQQELQCRFFKPFRINASIDLIAGELFL